MLRLTMIYNDKEADGLTKDQLIDAILQQYSIDNTNDNIIKAMEESFRCGFLRGEEYGRSM